MQSQFPTMIMNSSYFAEPEAIIIFIYLIFFLIFLTVLMSFGDLAGLVLSIQDYFSS